MKKFPVEFDIARMSVELFTEKRVEMVEKCKLFMLTSRSSQPTLTNTVHQTLSPALHHLSVLVIMTRLGNQS